MTPAIGQAPAAGGWPGWPEIGIANDADQRRHPAGRSFRAKTDGRRDLLAAGELCAAIPANAAPQPALHGPGDPFATAGPKFIQVGIDRFLTNVTAAQTALREAVFEHIQRLSLNYFDKTHQGRILNRADTDIESLDRILTWGANQLLASGLTLLGVLALMLRYDWRLCLAVSLVLPPLWIATRLFHVYGMRAYRKVREQSSRVTAALAEIITGVRVAQAFSREEENLFRFQQVQDVYRDRFLVVARIFHTYMP